MDHDEILRCGHPVADLHALIDHELASDKRRSVELRLIECSSCRAMVSAIQRTARALDAVGVEAPPPMFRANVMAEVRRHERRRAPLRSLVAAAAAVVILIGLSFSFVPTTTSADVVAEPTVAKPEIVVALPDPSDLSIDLDTTVVVGLALALVASGFLLRELVRAQEA